MRHIVKEMLSFMKGKVEQYFMTFMALDLKHWTVETLGQGLFNYCFSPEFRR